MSAVVALSGWGVALGLLAVMRRRLELVARAEHELRGPVTVLGLAAERLGPREAAALDVELHRLRSGLADLAAARRGRRASARPAHVGLETAARGALALGVRGRRAVVDWRAGAPPPPAPPGGGARGPRDPGGNTARDG